MKNSAPKSKPLLLDLDSLKSVALVLFGTLFFIVGIGTYFGGCDVNLQPSCGAYSIVDVQFTNYTMTQAVCRSCNSTTKDCQVKCRTGEIHCRRTCDTVCATYRYFDCFSTSATANYGADLSKKCTATGSTDNPNSTLAMEAVTSAFPLGSERTVLVPKPARSNPECVLLDSTEAEDASKLAEVGVAFLALTLIFMLGNFYLLNHLHGSWTSLLLSMCGMGKGRNRAGNYVKVLPFASALPFHRSTDDSTEGKDRKNGKVGMAGSRRRKSSDTADASDASINGGKARRPSFTEPPSSAAGSRGSAAGTPVKGAGGGAPPVTYRNR